MIRDSPLLHQRPSPQPPEAHSRPEATSQRGGLAFGVCGDLARRTGSSASVVRAAVVTLSALNGLGIVLYLGAALFWRDRPGLIRPKTMLADIGVAATTIGLIWTMSVATGIVRLGVVVSVGLISLGIALGWENLADTAEITGDTGSSRTAGSARTAALRVAVGIVLALIGAGLVLSNGADLGALRDATLAVAVALTGVGLVMGPTIIAGLRSFTSERDERVRAQERSLVASHLHDSVLQTLTLIQKNAEDPLRVATLARHQERSLRRWLYGGATPYTAESLDGGNVSWRAALESMVGEIENRYGTVIELVVVGPAVVLPEALQAGMIAATREALVNASKFSGETHLSVFGELTSGRLDVFVRDRGVGFDLATVAADRMGIRGSIIDRMRAIGGQATIRSTPGSGTEVALVLPITDDTGREPESTNATATMSTLR